MKGIRKSLLTILLSITAASFLYSNVTPVHAEDADFILKPRVPAKQLVIAKALVNPVPANEDSLAAGKEVYFKKGQCISCHGTTGRGDGPAGVAFNPGPRDFTDIRWQEVRTDGEIFWAITEGTDYGMMEFEDILTTEERWQAVNYIRELGKTDKIAQERK